MFASEGDPNQLLRESVDLYVALQNNVLYLTTSAGMDELQINETLFSNMEYGGVLINSGVHDIASIQTPADIPDFEFSSTQAFAIGPGQVFVFLSNEENVFVLGVQSIDNSKQKVELIVKTFENAF